jgi:primosomal protein N''
MNIDELLTNLYEVRTKISELQTEEKTYKRMKEDLESKLLVQLEQQGIDRVSNKLCTVSVKKETVPTVEQWDDLYKHIVQTNQFELLQKRMSATAYRELLQLGEQVPGVVSTELTKVNFRSKS